MRGRALVAGTARGPLLRLTHPISLWGGVDPRTGAVIDPRHPQCGAHISGCVMLVPSAVGSSSSSAIMLELIREGTAPAAVLMGRADAILALGSVVAAELGYAPVPVVELAPSALDSVADGAPIQVRADGTVEAVAEPSKG